MAKIKSTVYLGFDDEEISPKFTQLNSTVNKIGGTPDWPKASGDLKVPLCVLCGMIRPLILQLYAPLEESQFHRTLYIFACLNPSCSQNSKAWTCIRTQHLDSTDLINSDNISKKKISKPKINWCSGADDWGQCDEIGEDMDTEADDFQKVGTQNEENGNVIECNNICAQSASALTDEEDDDDSHSMENDIICDFGHLDLQPYQKQQQQNPKDDPNANCASGPGPDVNTFDDSNVTYAEIEAAETDVVLVETPERPVRDLAALLKHAPSFTSNGPLSKITDVTLKSYFIIVDIEQNNGRGDDYYCNSSLSEDHIREMYQDYKRQDEAEHSPNGPNPFDSSVAENLESYEKTLPAHGDLMFHQFLTTIQRNPGQILRYTRDSLPLLIAPLKEALPKCPNCNGDTICEVQVLSTLISKLRFQQNDDFAPIEYGNILVFTCLKSCWDTPDKMRYERIIVQAEK